MKNLNYITAMAVMLIGVGLVGLNAYAEDVTDSSTGVLNINAATVDELKMLPYIDSDTAQAIVTYRDSHGPFVSLDELDNVSGINRTLLNEISSHLTLEGESTFDPYGNIWPGFAF